MRIIKTTTKTTGRSRGAYERRTEPSQRRPQSRRKKKKTSAGPIAVICVLALVIAVAAGYILHIKNLAGTDTIFPNVKVAGVNVGGMTRAEAVEAIHAAVDGQYEQNTLQVKLPDRTLEFTPELTRVSVDVDAVVEIAWNYGREGSFWEIAKAYKTAEKGEYLVNVDDAVTLDTASVRALIDQTAEEVAQGIVRAEVNINKGAKTITITQGTPGRVLDADALYEAVLAAYANNDFTTLTMDYSESQPDKVDLLAIYDEFCYEPVDAEYDEDTGKVTPSTDGLGFDFEEENAKVQSLAAGETYTIQMQVIRPKVSTEDVTGSLFQDVLAEHSSVYVWNPARTKNLTLACEEIDGTILAPGEVFSFNDVVGERTAERGFQAAAVYVGVETADELGGGVCQVASTLYYCSLLANLEIVERTEHRYLVTYVDPGMDATIYWGLYDYQFRNSTNYPIKILANTEDGCVNITLLGTNETGEYVKMTYKQLSMTPYEEQIKVDLEQPPEYEQQTQSPYTGYEYETYRNVYSKDGELISSKKEDYSIYSARDKIITVGYGNPLIPEDYEYPEGTVLPELPSVEPDEPNDSGMDPWPDEEQPDTDYDSDYGEDSPYDPDYDYDPDLPPSGPTDPAEPSEPDYGDSGDEGGFEISGDA